MRGNDATNDSKIKCSGESNSSTCAREGGGLIFSIMPRCKIGTQNQ